MHFQDIYCIPKCEKLQSLLKTFTSQNQILILEEQLFIYFVIYAKNGFLYLITYQAQLIGIKSVNLTKSF